MSSAATRPGAGSLAAILLLVATAAQGLSEVEPGDSVDLDDDEGLLLAAIDNPGALREARLDKGGFLSASYLMEIGDEVGIHYVLLKGSAGTYTWTQLYHRIFRYTSWRLDNDRFQLTIEPGRMSYGGHLVVEADAGFLSQSNTLHLQQTNRSYDAFHYVRDNHPNLLDEYGFDYVGPYPDPYLTANRAALFDGAKAESVSLAEAFAPDQGADGEKGADEPDGNVDQQAGEASADAEPGADEVPASGNDENEASENADSEEPSPIEQSPAWPYFRNERILRTALGPDGAWVALNLNLPEQEDSEVVRILHIKRNEAHVVGVGSRQDRWVSDINWAGPRRVIIVISTSSNQTLRYIAEIGDDAELNLKRFTRPGHVVDYLPQEPGRILFAYYGDDITSGLYSVDLRREHPTYEITSDNRYAHNTPVEHARIWLTDSSGRPQLARVLDDEVLVTWVRDPRATLGWSKLRTDDLDKTFRPVWIDGDAETMLALSNRESNEIRLEEWDVNENRRTEVVHHIPGRDIASVVRRSSDGAVIGVRVRNGSELGVHWLDDSMTTDFARLETTWPDRQVAVLDAAAERPRWLVTTFSSRLPGEYFVYDGEDDIVHSLGRERPWLDPGNVPPTRVVHVTTDAGPVEGLITLPQDTDEEVPLLVMPHGGPVSISDQPWFEPSTQYFASRGYAVLRVNYRGSAGKGLEFLRAAKGEWGRGIERDTETVLDKVLASERYPVDPSRICVYGASYGGYSALTLARRNPGRFECIATVGAVTDLPLMFTSGYGAIPSSGMEFMKEYIGDPENALDQLVKHSPVDAPRVLSEPVLLVHGEDDTIVASEHAKRMVDVLRHHDRPVRYITYSGGHWPGRVGDQTMLHECLTRFFDKHLRR